MKKIFALPLTFLILFCCSCNIDVTNITFLSVNYGEYSATDGEFIYYIQKEGIYRASMDMEEDELLIQAEGISMITVDGNYLAYSQNDKKEPGSRAYSKIVSVVSLQAPETVLFLREMDTCYYIYLEDGMLYLYGINEQLKRIRGEEGAEYDEWGVYFCDITQGEALHLVTDDMCQKPSQSHSLLVYEDDNICWFYDNNRNVSAEHNAIYSKKQGKLITNFWGDQDYLKPTDDGILALNNSELLLITPETDKTLLVLPDKPVDEQGVPSVFTGWIELPNNRHLFFAERYTFLNSMTGGPSLEYHLYDSLYLVDDNYELMETFWTEKGEKIIYANDRFLILLKDNTLFTVDYLVSDNREEFATIKSYGSTLTVEECGGNLLFFHGNVLKEFVALPTS